MKNKPMSNNRMRKICLLAFVFVLLIMPQAVSQLSREKAEHKIDIIGPECAVPLDAPYINMKILAGEVKNISK